MAPKIEIIGLKGIPLINPGDNISQIIFENLKNNEINLKNNWIIFKDDKDLNRLNMNLKSN